MLPTIGNATLCGDRRGRGAKTRVVFCFFRYARATLCGDRRGRGAKTRGFLLFLVCPRDPLRRSAVEVQELEVFVREMAFASCLVVCAPAFVAGSMPPWSAAAPA